MNGAEPASENPVAAAVAVTVDAGVPAPGMHGADPVVTEPAITADELGAPSAAFPSADADRALVSSARRYADASRAASTRRAYQTDWRAFSTWCLARGFETLPADPRIVALFLAAQAESGIAPPTLGRRLAAIGFMHRRAGVLPPQHQDGDAALRAVLAGIRRQHGVAPVRKRAADADILRALLDTLPGDDLRSVRDRALLALGMAGAFRRSELVALQVEDLIEAPDGFRVVIRHSKTDQKGVGQEIAIPRGARLRPVEAVQAWLEAAGITTGPPPARSSARSPRSARWAPRPSLRPVSLRW